SYGSNYDRQCVLWPSTIQLFRDYSTSAVICWRLLPYRHRAIHPAIGIGYVKMIGNQSKQPNRNGGPRLIIEQFTASPIKPSLRARCGIVREHDHEIARRGPNGGVTLDRLIPHTRPIPGNSQAGQYNAVGPSGFGTIAAFHRDAMIAEIGSKFHNPIRVG